MTQNYDHKFEPGAYGVCKRCGEERHLEPGKSVPIAPTEKYQGKQGGEG